MTWKIRIRKYQFGLWFRRGDFYRLLHPGAYLIPGRLFGGDQVRVVNTMKTAFEHRLLEVLLMEPAVLDKLLVVDLNDSQRALVWKDGRLAYILGPGKHAFWKEPYELRVEEYDVRRPRFEHEQLDAVLAHPDAHEFLTVVPVQVHGKVLVFRAGKLIEIAGPGRHAFWTEPGLVSFNAVDLREQVADVGGQEIMTADKVTLRVNLVVTYQVRDPEQAVSEVSDYGQALYREAQLALRAVVGGRSLEQLLGDKEAIGKEVQKLVGVRAAEFGVAIKSVGLRDIVLPGDMKKILNQVIEAQKQAEANLIRRREETAAARSQANTAKLLAENPVLAKMKELEALQEILRGAKTTFVFGPGPLGDQIKALIAGSEGER